MVRPWSAVLLRLCGWSIVAGPVFLRTGPEGEKVSWLILMELCAALENFKPHPCVLIGDWSMEPDELWDTGAPEKMGATIVVPKSAFTCATGAGRLLDYVLVYSGCAPVVGVAAVLTGQCPLTLVLALRSTTSKGSS